MKRGQYIFRLDILSIENLINEHYMPKKDEKEEIIEYEGQVQTTDISITTKKQVFYDINKNKIIMWITMEDLVNQKILPLVTNLPCWWCGYQFISSPLGAPIIYCPHNSIVSVEFRNFFSKRNIDLSETDLLKTEGIFCSFPCCKAYIMTHSFISKYKNSITLLSLLYYKLYGKYIDIPRAPTWKILEKWGGPLSIEDFRNSFSKFIYQVTPNIKRPFMFATGTYIEEINA